jgi:hypothetical protein
MKIELPPIPDAERTPLVEALLAIIDIQQQRIAQIEETVGQLRDEIAILKGEQPRPKITPSRRDEGQQGEKDQGPLRGREHEGSFALERVALLLRWASRLAIRATPVDGPCPAVGRMIERHL